MRVITEISETQILALDALARRLNISRAALIGAAVDDFLSGREAATIESGFGLWSDTPGDGMAQQEALRREW